MRQPCSRGAPVRQRMIERTEEVRFPKPTLPHQRDRSALAGTGGAQHANEVSRRIGDGQKALGGLLGGASIFRITQVYLGALEHLGSEFRA